MGIKETEVERGDGSATSTNGPDTHQNRAQDQPAPSGEADEGVTPIDARNFEASFKIRQGSRYLLHNRTPYLIHLVHPDERFGELLLPPFAQRVIKGARLHPFESLVRPHRQRHEVFVRRYEESVSFVARLIWFAWIALIALLGVAIFDILTEGSVAQWEFFTTAAITVVVIAAVLIGAALREMKRKNAAASEGTEAGDIAFGIGGSYSDGNDTARSAQQLLTLALVLTVGAVLPAIAIIVATDAKDFLILEGGLRVKSGLESRLVARIIQITYTCVLSLFPALLFFQFDRLRAGSVRGDWVRALFRMDGRMRTMADIDATYGDAMYEASNNSDDSVRGLGGKHSPIVIATILIALGWTILVVRTESFDFSGDTAASQQVQVAEEQAARAEEAATSAGEATTAEEANAAAADATSAATAASSAQEATAEVAETSTQSDSAVGDTAPDQPDDSNATQTTMAIGEAQAMADAAAVEADQAAQAASVEQSQIQSTSFFQVLAPNPSAAGMAFLGAYFFGVYLVLRSYFRGDLRSKIYNQITARLVTVVVLAYLINAILFGNTDQQEVIWALAFLAGVVPTTVLDRMFNAMGGMVQAVAGETFSTNRPLEHIDGIDIYDSSRLEVEGIPDVAALATSDLTSVMLQTRLPIGRVIDWADQAALMVVVGVPGSQLDPRVRCLRSRGIRTGTDLLAAAEGDGNVDEVVECLKIPPNPKFKGWWQKRRARKDPAPEPAPDPGGRKMVEESIVENDVNIDDLCQAIRRQPVMSQILQWRSSALDDVDRSWILLPEPHADPIASSSYEGPLPSRVDRRDAAVPSRA
jgi:hypothetical protein